MGKSLYGNTNVNNENTRVLTTGVTVTAAELIATTTPNDVVKTLIPSPGVDKYIEIHSLVVKFTNASVAFDVFGTYSITDFDGRLTINYIEELVTPKIIGFGVGVIADTNTPVDLILAKGSAPTTGDGDLIIEIEYSIKDF